MIQLTRLNNTPLIVNSDLIKFVEQSPDTFVTLITGENRRPGKVGRGAGPHCRVPPLGPSPLSSCMGPSVFARHRAYAEVPADEPRKSRVDKSSLGGIVLAVGGIVAGLLLEGGNLRQVLQPTAAIIVLAARWAQCCCNFPRRHSARIAAYAWFSRPQSEPEARLSLRSVCAERLAATAWFLSMPTFPTGRRLPEEIADAGGRRHRAAGAAQDDGTGDRQSNRIRGERSQSIRVRGRICAHHRHHRRGTGTDPGDAAPGQHRRSGHKESRSLSWPPSMASAPPIFSTCRSPAS